MAITIDKKHNRAVKRLSVWRNEKRLKLWEIRAKTELSLATLSNAVNRPEDMSQETIDAILRATK